MDLNKKISINNDFDIVTARMQVRDIIKQMGFSPADQSRVSLAASELARIISWRRTQQGEISLSLAHKNGHQGIQLVCLVDREYIPHGEVSHRMSEASAPQRSLSGARQLVDENHIEVLDAQRARVTLMKWLVTQ